MPSPYKKILILSVSAGAGHVRAADALIKAFNIHGGAQEIVHLDTLQYTSKTVRNLYAKAYFEMARNAPDLLGWIYGYLDKPWKNEKKMRAVERLNVALFMRLLRRIQPDLVVNTHFLPADIISYLRKKEKLSCKQAVVITDFDAHALWLNRDVDYYFTACEEESEYLRQLGIEPSRITTSGIPIDPVFGQHKDKVAMRKKYGFDPDLATLLISAGGYDIPYMQHVITSLTRLTRPTNVLVMCGRNEEMKNAINKLMNETPSKLKVHAVGYTTQMDEYMSASDILIGKPGGLTISEALAKGLAMIVLNPIPGQEERNSDYLLEQGAALKCNNLLTLGYKVESLLGDAARLASMQSAALRIATPGSAAVVVGRLMGGSISKSGSPITHTI